MYVCTCVCLCVCVCVCVCIVMCGSPAVQTNELILMKVSTNDLKKICEIRFSQILTF